MSGANDCDVIIVGGGAAGAVLAYRLSLSGHRRVVLIEAGPAEPPTEEMRRAIRNPNQPAVVEGLNWKIRTSVRDLSSAATWDYEAGKILGGSSSVNSVQALRGLPGDYDSWARELAAPEWAWRNVLPLFRLLEDDPEGRPEVHGSGGPIPIRRDGANSLTTLQSALLRACIDRGFPETPDHNDPDSPNAGVGPLPKNVLGGVRMSSTRTYLTLADGLTGLEIQTGALVQRLLWDGTTCTGVEFEIDGNIERLSAGSVILTAGAIHTPALLQRSGVGDPHHLRALEIPVVVALAGVGQNLQDHPTVGIWGIPRGGSSSIGESMHQVLLKYATRGSAGADIHIRLMSGLDFHTIFPERSRRSGIDMAAAMSVCLTKATSRGQTRITSTNASKPPSVALNFFSTPNDLVPLKEGVRVAWDLFRSPPLEGLFEKVFGWSDSLVKSDAALEQAIRAYSRPAAHLGGTARMGRASDPLAVVDASGRVFGAENLWVADASIMPTIPSAPPHLTCVMIAEKIARDLEKAL